MDVRREAEERAIAAGADPASVEVSVEVDPSSNMVRATAIGTTELRSKDLTNRKLSVDKLREVVADNLSVTADQIKVTAENGVMYAMQYQKVEKKLFGLLKSRTTPTRIVDEEGVIRLQKRDGHVISCSGAKWEQNLPIMIENYTDYGESTKNLPNIYVIFGKRIVDLSGLETVNRVMSLAKIELANCKDDDRLIILCSERAD